MRLDQYLTEQSISQSDFGSRLEPPVTQGAVSQWIQGVARISLHRALEIERLTGGAVTVHDCAAIPTREREAAA